MTFTVDKPGVYKLIYQGPLPNPTPEPTPVPVPSTKPIFGVQLHALWEFYWEGKTPKAQLIKHMDTLALYGVKVLRVDIGWSAFQPINSNPVPITSTTNQRFLWLLDAADTRGMKILATIHQSPAWSRPNTGTEVKQYPVNKQHYANFVGQFLTMFGKFPALFAVELWNEPNLSGFTQLMGNAQVAPYAELLNKTISTVKAATNLTTPIMFGGPSQNDRDFFRAVRDRMLAIPDLYSVHPYQADQTVAPNDLYDINSMGSVQSFGQFAGVVSSNLVRERPFWWSEYGFSIHNNMGTEAKWKKGVSEMKSADYHVQMLKLAREWDVKGIVAYVAYRPAGDVHEQGYSLLTAEGTAKLPLVAMDNWYRFTA